MNMRIRSFLLSLLSLLVLLGIEPAPNDGDIREVLPMLR